MEKLKRNEIKLWRDKLLKRQNGKCPICGLELTEDEAVLDHDHVTGHIRGALHPACNRLDGKCINWAYRTKGNDYPQMMMNLAKYWEKDYSKLPIHPTHKTAEEKRLARNAKARKTRAKRKKNASN